MALAADRPRYVVHEHEHRNGEPLFTLHSISGSDIELFRTMLASKRATNTVVLVEGQLPPGIRTRIEGETDRIDQLIRCFNTTRHAPHQRNPT